MLHSHFSFVILHSCRLGGFEYPFVIYDMSNELTHFYDCVYTQDNIMSTYKLLSAGGTRLRTSKSVQVIFQYGGTIGPARYPTFVSSDKLNKKHMLPRPVVKSRPYQLGHFLMTKCTWLIKLCQHVESLTLNYLQENESQLTVHQTHQRTQLTVSALERALFSKKHIPPCLRICDTFFTQMILVGSFSHREGNIPPHEDSDDYVTALVSLGQTETLVGGDTFYSEKTPDGLLRIIRRVPYRHGNIQIGIFNDVKHGAFTWKHGYRGVINLSLKKQMVEHFYKYGCKYYVQYMEAGYPSGDFVAS